MSMIERLRHAVESWTWSNAHDADDVAKFIALYDAVEAADYNHVQARWADNYYAVETEAWNRIESAFRAIREAE